MPVTTDRGVPHNIEAEEATLGSILIGPDAISKVSEFLHPEDFHREKHRLIFQAMLAMHIRGEEIDFVTLCNELERGETLETIGGAAAVSALLHVVPTAFHVEHYAHIVERTSILRQIITAAGKIARLAYDDNESDVRETLSNAERILFDISQGRSSESITHIRDILGKYYEHIDYLFSHQGEFTGVPTGYYDLDKMLGGLQAGDLIIIAARPSVGKTSLALNIVENVAVKQAGSVALFSLEMGPEQIAQRLISSHTGIDSQNLRLGKISDAELDRVVHAIGVLSESQIYVDATPAISPLEVRSKARRLEGKVNLILVDYLQLMRSGSRSENRVQEISAISRALKALARETKVPVIALSQLSRELERRQDKRPMLSDLRESGSIEQDADVVMFIYREDMYLPETERRDIAEIIVAKHRNGPTGNVKLRFIKTLAKFVSLETISDDTAHESGLSVDF